MINYIEFEISKSIDTKKAVLKDEKVKKAILDAARMMVECYKRGNKVIFAGNGGSAADAQHLAAELVSKFYFDRPALPSIAITTNTSILTAIGNDYGYEVLFTRQIQANYVEGDVVCVLTTTGNSQNIVHCLRYCKENNIEAICLTGNDGGVIEKESLATISIVVPDKSTPRIQETHILIGHILCGIIEKEMFKNGDKI